MRIADRAVCKSMMDHYARGQRAVESLLDVSCEYLWDHNHIGGESEEFTAEDLMSTMIPALKGVVRRVPRRRNAQRRSRSSAAARGGPFALAGTPDVNSSIFSNRCKLSLSSCSFLHEARNEIEPVSILATECSAFANDADRARAPRPMQAARIWLVRNPGPIAVLQDIVMPLSADEFAAYAIGTGLVRFRHERHTMHTTEESAMQDAHDRLARRG